MKNKRNRITTSLAGISPDVDGVGLLIDIGLMLSHIQTNFWGEWHHKLHSLPFGILVSIAAALVVKTKRVLTFVISFLLFNLHIFCDVIGSRGPNGYQWPIPYLFPFDKELRLSWSGQWELNAWPNMLITFVALLCACVLIRYKKSSPFEVFSKKMDTVLTNMLVSRNA